MLECLVVLVVGLVKLVLSDSCIGALEASVVIEKDSVPKLVLFKFVYTPLLSCWDLVG